VAPLSGRRLLCSESRMGFQRAKGRPKAVLRWLPEN
jgi:hypothetical protein